MDPLIRELRGWGLANLDRIVDGQEALNAAMEEDDSISTHEAALFVYAAHIREIETKLAAAERDAGRMEFVINHGACVQPIGDPAHAFRLDWCDGSGEEPEWKMTYDHASWREAIDAAIKDKDNHPGSKGRDSTEGVG